MSNKTLVRRSLLALCAVGTVVLVAVMGSRAPKAEDEGKSLDLSASGPALDRGVTSPPTSELSRAVVQQPESVSTAEVSAAEDQPARAKVEEQKALTFEEKYADSTLEQLISAKWVLEHRRDVDRDRILKELVAAKRLVEVPLDADGNRSLHGNKDGSPMSFVQTFEFVDGVNVSKAAVITGEEYPDYRALELETWWLECKLHMLEKQAKAEVSTAK